MSSNLSGMIKQEKSQSSLWSFWIAASLFTWICTSTVSVTHLNVSCLGYLGLKPGQRKVLFTCLKRNDKREVKVAQLAGSVAEMSAYHHGEVHRTQLEQQQQKQRKSEQWGRYCRQSWRLWIRLHFFCTTQSLSCHLKAIFLLGSSHVLWQWSGRRWPHGCNLSRNCPSEQIRNAFEWRHFLLLNSSAVFVFSKRSWWPSSTWLKTLWAATTSTSCSPLASLALASTEAKMPPALVISSPCWGKAAVLIHSSWCIITNTADECAKCCCASFGIRKCNSFQRGKLKKTKGTLQWSLLGP